MSGGFNKMRSISINIPMVPPSANVLKRKYRSPHAYKGLRKEWERSIWYSIDTHHRYWLESMAKLGKKMSMHITIQHKKLYDPDNAVAGCKPVLDALVNLKLLADDDNEHLELNIDQEKINSISTRIQICEA